MPLDNQPGGQAGATNDTKPTETAAEMQARIRREEIARSNTLRAMCNGFWPDDSARSSQVSADLIERGLNEDQAKVHIFDLLAKERKPVGTGGADVSDTSLRPGASQVGKLTQFVADGLALRMFGDDVASRFHMDRQTGRYQSIMANGYRQLPTRTRTIHPDAQVFRGMRLIDIASEYLNSFGVNTRGMAPADIAKKALAWEREGMPMASAGGEFHRSADFPYILMDAVNKSMLAGYVEASPTYRQWVHICDPAPDFKTIHRMRLGEASDLEVIPEGKRFPEDKLVESKESYGIETRGKAISFTRVMLINDDMNALSVLPMRQGRAADRTVNRFVYGILVANDVMADNVALFHTSHANVITSGAGSVAPNVAAFNAMQSLLRLQTGLNTETPVTLNTEMKFVIVPSSIEGSTLEMLASTSNPASSNANVPNIWRNRVTPIVEAMLDGAGDANPTTRYFGVADWRDVDTVEVTFLQGEETPVAEQEYDFDTKGRKYTIHQTFGGKAVDWKGMVRNKGS